MSITKSWRWLWAILIAVIIGYGIPLVAEEKKDQGKPAIAEDKKASDKVVKTPENAAMVNGTAIPFDEFNREVTQFKQRISMQGQVINETQLADVKKEILDNMIGRELLSQETRKSGIKADPKEIEEEYAKTKKSYPDEASFKEGMSAMGFSEQTLKTQIEKGLMLQKFVDKEFSEKTAVSDKESKEYYDGHPELFKKPEQVKASHILIKTDAKADQAQKDTAHKKIESIQQQVKEGKDFSELAKQHSECPSKEKGGDLGFFKRGDMAKPFEEAAFSLKPGTVSDIVETRFGYHLIKVTDKKPESAMTYDSVKEKLGQYLKNEKLQKELDQYVQKLKEKSTIQKFL